MIKGLTKFLAAFAGLGALVLATPSLALGQLPNSEDSGRLQESTTQTEMPSASIQAAFRGSSVNGSSYDFGDSKGVRWRFVKDTLLISNEPTTTDQTSSSSSPSGSPQEGSAARSKSYNFPSSHERFRRYTGDMFGPFAFIGVAFSAGISQIDDNPREWGRGGDGYGKRFASSLGAHFTDQTVKYGLSEALREDSGFYKSSRNGIKDRAFDAAIQAVTSRKRDGSRVFSIPRIAGDYAGGFVVLAWEPARYTYRDGLRSGTGSILTSVGVNLLREFLFK